MCELDVKYVSQWLKCKCIAAVFNMCANDRNPRAVRVKLGEISVDWAEECMKFAQVVA